VRSLVDFARDLARSAAAEINTTRCPGPVHGAAGWHRCVIRADSCDEHDRWPMLPMAIVWRIRPWWPNRLGRAMDRGCAHTCPQVNPCKRCATEAAGGP
jgi:hypothetical protein